MIWSVSILYHKVSTRENEVPYSLVVSLKTALSRKLLRFHQPGDVVDAQTMESFIKVLKSTLSYDFLKQIDLDDIVDTMKKFQEEHDN